MLTASLGIPDVADAAEDVDVAADAGFVGADNAADAEVDAVDSDETVMTMTDNRVTILRTAIVIGKVILAVICRQNHHYFYL